MVVRPSRRQSPIERIEEILQLWERELGRPLPRPVVLSGDICEPGFGLSAEDREWVRQNCGSIIHSAAILEFYGKDRAGEPWRTNLNGTQNMIQLCRDLNIRDIHYVSTAYVAGYQTERVMEDSLDAGQTFRNDYEESKFLAEQLVRKIDFAEHVTVYRPAVISGDSRTGYTNTYHGIYLYLRLMAMMIPAIPPDKDGKRSTPIRLRMTGEERRNIIPVEWVSAVTVRLFETPEARGKTFHLAPENPMRSGNMINYCEEYFNTKGAMFVGYDAPAGETVTREENEDQWLFERLCTENMETYAPYERTDNTFDISNTQKFAGDIVCPEIDRTVIHRYIEFGNEDRWGKRRPEIAEPVFDADEFINGLQLNGEKPEVVIGVDLTGPGGTQMTLGLSRTGICSVERGLPETAAPVLRVTAEEFGSGIQAGAVQLFSQNSAWELPEGTQPAELAELLQNTFTRFESASSV